MENHTFPATEICHERIISAIMNFLWYHDIAPQKLSHSRFNEPRGEIEKSSLCGEFVISKIFKIQNFGFQHRVSSKRGMHQAKVGQKKKKNYIKTC